jgi:hypothetical protein
MIINETNFLRWNDQNPSTAQPVLPHPYRRDLGGCPYTPIAFPTEQISFYINKPTGFGPTDFSGTPLSGLRLDLVNASTNVAAATGIGTLQQVFLNSPTNTIYHLYASFVVPSVPVGLYYLRVFRTSAGVPVLISNYILVRSDKANLDRETVLVRFRHDRQFYNVRYQNLPGFYQQFRLHLNVLERQVDSDKEVYKEVTTGRVRTSENYLSRYYRIESYYFDDDAHEAAAVMFEHDYLEINGRQYVVKTTYKENPNQLSVYTKGEAEIWDQAFASVNRC